MASTLWYVNGVKNCISAGCGLTTVTGTVKMMFLSSAYVPNFDTHVYVSDVNANEVTGTGVAAGGVAVSSLTATADTTNNAGVLDFADIIGINVTGCYSVLYVSTGTATTSPLLCCTDYSDGTGVDQVITAAILASNGYAALTAA